MNLPGTPLRFASAWQRRLCSTCSEETVHYKNACIHCGHIAGGPTVTVTVQYNGREMVSRLTDEQRAQARQMLSSGTPPKIVATKLRVSAGTIYRLNPLTRGG